MACEHIGPIFFPENVVLVWFSFFLPLQNIAALGKLDPTGGCRLCTDDLDSQRDMFISICRHDRIDSEPISSLVSQKSEL